MTASPRRVVVFHGGYGCDTGCCGHYVQVDDESEAFEFEHPYGEDPRAFAERLVREVYGDEHVADLDWENCVVTDE